MYSLTILFIYASALVILMVIKDINIIKLINNLIFSKISDSYYFCAFLEIPELFYMVDTIFEVSF
jgi:hypothetical protein